MNPDSSPFAKLVQTIDTQNTLLQAWELKGGVSAQVTALEVQRADGQRVKWIVRQHGAIDRARNPHIARDEFRLLQHLHSADLAVPQPHTVDETGAILGLPCIVMDFIEGQTDFAPPNIDHCLHQLATHLVRIHRVDTEALDFLPVQNAAGILKPPAQLDDSIEEGRIRAALEAVYPLPQVNRTGLLHGDFWLGNTLWQAGELVAVIDWEDAALGDPLADLANTRLEILWAFGMAAMEHFTADYQALMEIDFTSLPYWDLYMALRPAFKIAEWAGDALIEQHMRERHRQFVEQAFAKL